MTAELAVLRDRREIEDVLIRYANGLDRRDLDMVRACFHDDVLAEYSGVRLEAGVDAVIEHMRVLWNVRSSLHLLGNVEVALEGDEARSVCRAVAYLVRAEHEDRGTVAIRGLVYEDRLVRTPNGWRIIERRHVPEWEVEAPVTILPTCPDHGAHHPGPGPHFGTNEDEIGS